MTQLPTQPFEEFLRLQELAEEISLQSTQFAEVVPYYNRLVEIRNAFEQSKEFHFPYLCCQNVSRVVKDILGPNYNLEEVAGSYLFGENLAHSFHHAWNYDSKRKLYVDLSLDQFFLEFPPITIMPTPQPFLKEINEYTHQQRIIQSLGVDRIIAQLSQ